PWAQPGRTIRATIRLRPPRLATLPTDFPEWDYCAHLDVQWMGFARASDVSLWEEQSRSHIDLLEFLAHQRQRLREWIAELYPSDIRPLALALLVGDRSELAPQQRREFALTGAAHVLAISGLHVGVVAGIVFIVLGFLPYRWLRWLCASLLIVLFVGLTGAQPSALRAAGMAILGSALYLLQRQPHPVNVVAAVAFGLLLLQPELLFSRSFQLSVLATLGIVGLFGPFAQWLQQLAPALPQFLRDMVALTLAATCGSASVAALAFGIFSLLSIPINVAAVPMSGAALIAGLLGMLFHGAVPPVGELYTSAAIACLRGLTWLTHHAAQLPFAALEGHSAAVAAVGASAGLLWLLKAQRWLHVLLRFCVVVAGIALGSYWLRPSIQPQLAPRERLVAAFLPTAPDTTVVVLIDRLPRHKPKRDPALEDYLRILSGHLSIAYTGYTSELLALQCFRSRPNVSVLPAPPAIVDYIHQLFRSPQPLRQLYRPLLLPANSERLK
ncbi:MAG: ComEC/Rec2 family competence protein, partial [Chlorobiota bacterium]